MKRVFYLSILVIELMGCSHKTTNSQVYKVRIPLANEAGHYSLQTAELHTVTDIHALAGATSRIRTDGNVTLQRISDTQSRVIQFDEGNTPSAKYVQIDDTFYPSDLLTLSMATATYHFENIKLFFDAFDANQDVTFPRTLLFNVKNVDVANGVMSTMVNNASFSLLFDLFLLMPYEMAQVPLVMNGGVLAHEYAHSIFLRSMKRSGLDLTEKLKETDDYLFEWSNSNIDSPTSIENTPAVAYLGSITSPETARANLISLRGADEGIADYFGYEYASGDPAFLLASTPDATYRHLGKEKYFPDTSETQFAGLIKSMREKTLDASRVEHLWGSFVARFFYLAAQEYGHEKTKAFVYQFEQNLTKWMSENMENRFFSMNDLITLFLKDKDKPSESFARGIIRAFPKQFIVKSVEESK